MFRDTGVLLPTVAAEQIRSIANEYGQTPQITVIFDGYTVTCRHTGLEGLASLDRILLVYGLLEAAKTSKDRQVNVKDAAKRAFKLDTETKNPRTPSERLELLMRETGLVFRKSKTGLENQLTDIERDFSIKRRKARGKVNIDQFIRDFVQAVYERFDDDLHRTAEFFGEEKPIIYDILRLAGKPLDIPDDIMAFNPPDECFKKLPGKKTDHVGSIRHILAELFRHGQSRIGKQKPVNRTWLDEMAGRLKHEIDVIIFHDSYLEDRYPPQKELLFSVAWAHFNHYIQRQANQSLLKAGVDPEQLLEESIKDRAIFCNPANVMGYALRDYELRSVTPKKGLIVTTASFWALFWHFRCRVIMPAPSDRNLLSLPSMSRDVEVKALSELGVAISKRNQKPRKASLERYFSEHYGRTVTGARAQRLMQDVNRVAATLADLATVPSSRFFLPNETPIDNLREKIRTTIRALTDIAKPYEQGKTVAQRKLLDDYYRAVLAVYELCSAIAGETSEMDLYRMVYEVRKLEEMTVIGSIPSRIKKDAVLNVSFYCYRRDDHTRNQVAPSEHAYLISFPSEDSHRSHLNFSNKTFIFWDVIT